MKNLVYMRQLPPNLISFSSKKGKLLFQQALQQHTLECYFPLSEQFITQLHPTTCGATTLVMVLNALKVDPEVQWKGIWRWYTEENLHGVTTEHLANGIDLDGLSHIAQHNKVDIETFYHPNLYSVDLQTKSRYDCKQQCQKISNISLTAAYSTFLLCLECTSRREKFFMIVNNSRKVLGQTGSGHFSPIGGVNLNQQSVLLFDVARFKYPPQWCNFDLLYNSMAPIDPDTNMTRGFCLVTKQGDCEQYDTYSQEQFRKEQNDRKIFSHNLCVLMVFYLFQVLQRIKNGRTNIQSIDFYQALLKECQVDPKIAEQNISQNKNLWQLIKDFTEQYPDLLKTISCLLNDLLNGIVYNQQNLKEELQILKNNLGI